MRDLGIYNNSEPKKTKEKKDSGITRREFFCILATMFVVVYSSLYIYKIETSEDTPSPCEQPIQQQEVKQTRMAVTLPDSYNPTSPITYHNGVREERVSTSVITSPYTWNYIIKGVQTSDSMMVTLQTGITSQIRDGYAKLLMQNYGGNWFYTVFVKSFENEVKTYILRQGLSYNDLKYNARQVKLDKELTAIAKNVVDSLSGESLLPVDILNVSITSVEKK